MTMSQKRLIFIIILITVLSFLLSLVKGSTSFSFDQLVFRFSDINDQAHDVFFKLRLPRTTTAFVAGGLLALAGALMQILLQNPLADPYALGVSGGAALFTLLLMLCGANELITMSGAWAGSFLTMLLIFGFAKKHAWRTDTLVLLGIALACGFSAAISFILLMTPDAHLRDMLFWLSGDLSYAGMPWIGVIILLAGLIIAWLLAPGLNLLGRGEESAQTLGISTKHYRIALYLLSSLLTATAVMLVGCISFVGLIVPHFTRLLVGFDHRIMLPVTVMVGGSLLVIADMLASSLFAPEQLPVGIFLALIGVPTFIVLLFEQRHV
jgi:iron complex transport system permease protein